MSMEEKRQTGLHTLTMEGRTRAMLTGVTTVSCFNDREIVLETSAGEIVLLGERLHIGQLNLENGQLDVTGEVAGIEYNEPSGAKTRGLFARKKK